MPTRPFHRALLRRFVLQAFPLVFVALAGGCASEGEGQSGKDNPPAGSVQIAACNLDKVAEELGLRQEMDQLLSDRKALLNSEVRNVQQQLQDALNKKIEEAGDAPTEEQKKQLARLQLESNQRLRQAQTRATQLLAQYRQSLIRQIRTKIKIPIDKVARDKGINLVVTEHPDFLIFSSGAADITPDVISAAREAELGGLEPETSAGGDEATDSDVAPTPGKTDAKK